MGQVVVTPGPLYCLPSTRESPESGVWGIGRLLAQEAEQRGEARGIGSSCFSPALALHPPRPQGHRASSVKPEAGTGPAAGPQAKMLSAAPVKVATQSPSLSETLVAQ